MAEKPPARPSPRPRPAPGGGPGRPYWPPQIGNLPISAIAVIAIAVAVLVWLLLIRGDDDSDSSGAAGEPQAEKTVEVLSASELPSAVSDVGYSVYWIGTRPEVGYELTVITDGRTYVRYLPPDAAPETETPYLTVGSYAQDDSYSVLQRLGRRPGSEVVEIPDGGVVLRTEGKSNGVYVAYPGDDTQIEIFDPEPGRALALATSGALTPLR